MAVSVKNGSVSQFMPSLFSGYVSSIAIDWLARNLYWADTKAGTIEVMKLDGEHKYEKVLLSNTGKASDCAKPVAIALDPTRG